ncbi:2-succinyl-5-enolpyruvyl-6-hydroxy-3-cyclohexene-1-carboxylic-acid synthase [Avrilella dinanensis]|uniref:2-succinyl-5-enolpyruvyl-6-hydroxy-3- cyclohexene-1-carboxylic-acid synthase n=1 Tax=Avrilella dinanensis TaxID=2008672 RepID=UPI00240A1A43|nr:2-succinyl-5-enolpyruvyl-6-hydroxy-3-cyclohexene-1-carboxylic-acid synthase [Avrilella dinanensis]
MIIPEIPLAQSVLQLFKAKHIQHIVISPGSRNAPLTIGFSSDAYFRCYSIADERCAGFFALGIARELKQPVALLCTSGSAVLNYYPAVAEAFYSQIPLIVCSADRPLAKIDIGDGQTIRQQNVLTNHTVFNANLTENACPENDRLIQKAIHESQIQKGPVHINIPFEEPLYNTVETPDYTPELIDFSNPDMENINWKKYQEKWVEAKKILVLIGSQQPGSLSENTIRKLAQLPNVVVMTEINSNIRDEHFVNHIDILITPFGEQEFQALQPDILVTIGGMVVSKRIKSFLRNYPPKEHWHVDLLRAYDTFGVLSDEIQSSAETFFSQMSEVVTSSDYQQNVLQVVEQRKIQHQHFLANAPYSDWLVYAKIWKNLPENIRLEISNSAAIRYAQLFETPKNTEVFCNRGTSGIDGSTSTAIGAAVHSHKPTLLVTGDISFFYDSNALWNAYIPQNFKIILINNGGGGIFRILPGHQEKPNFNQYFETQHQLSAEYLAKMFNFDYYLAENESSLNEGLEKLWNAEKPAILEVFTPTKMNNQILKQYFESLK